MITNNPYNLPDKILKPNQITKPITLQNKKSRDRSYDYSKELSTKGIKIQSQMKKSLNLQHITSSPNLHTPSTSSSTNRPVQPQNLPRPVEYHQTHIQQIPETEHDRRIKFLFEKFYQMNEQLTSHDSILNKLAAQKQKSERNSWDSPFQLNGMNQRESRDKQEMIRNQARSFHNNGQTGVNSPGNDGNINLKQIDQIKKQVNNLKQQILGLKSSINRDRQQQNNTLNISKSLKLNQNAQYESIKLERKFADDFSRIYQTMDQLRASTQDKLSKIQNSIHKIDTSNQIVVHKVNKAQQRIENLESNVENHMKLVNQQINNALTKIVASINQKISKALENNISVINQKLKKSIQTCKSLIQDKKSNLTLNPTNIEGKIMINSGTLLKLSGYKAEGKITKISMKSIVTISDQKNRQRNDYYQQKSESSPTKGQYNSTKGEYSPSKQSSSSQEIILNNNIYYIDSDGYLLDENQIYLVDQDNNLLQLQPQKLMKIKEFGMFA